MIGRPPKYTLFPYPTPFQWAPDGVGVVRHAEPEVAAHAQRPGGGVRVRRRPDREPRPDAGAQVHDEQPGGVRPHGPLRDRKSTRLNSSHANISYAVFCLKKK